MVQPGDFYEDDGPSQDVIRAFENGQPTESPQSRGWFCEHMALTYSHTVSAPTTGCGCTLLPLAG